MAGESPVSVKSPMWCESPPPMMAAVAAPRRVLASATGTPPEGSAWIGHAPRVLDASGGNRPAYPAHKETPMRIWHMAAAAALFALVLLPALWTPIRASNGDADLSRFVNSQDDDSELATRVAVLETEVAALQTSVAGLQST